MYKETYRTLDIYILQIKQLADDTFSLSLSHSFSLSRPLSLPLSISLSLALSLMDCNKSDVLNYVM